MQDVDVRERGVREAWCQLERTTSSAMYRGTKKGNDKISDAMHTDELFALRGCLGINSHPPAKPDGDVGA